MTDDKRVQNLLELRKWVIDQYNRLDRVQPSAQMTHKEVATIYETIVNSIDDLVRDKVTFT